MQPVIPILVTAGTAGGTVVGWALNGTNVIGGAELGNPGPSWHVMGSGNYNTDGRSDILFRNSSSEVAIWSVSGGSVIDSASIANPRSHLAL